MIPDKKSGGIVSVVWVSDSNMIKARIKLILIMGTFIKKIHCHPKEEAMMPPNDSPQPDPMAANELNIPSALLLAASVTNVFVMIAMADGMRRAAPKPWMARKKNKNSKEFALPAPIEVIRNNKAPDIKTFFLPQISASLPPIIRNPPYRRT